MGDPDTTARWRNRITRHADVAPENLPPNPANWRRHPAAQQAALTGVLDQLGYIQAVVVNERTGRLVDGHLRVEIAKQQGQPTVPVTYVDLTEDEERLALATLDPLAALAETDQAQLQSLLGNLSASEDAGLRSLLDQLAKEAKGIDETEEPGRAGDDDVPSVTGPTVSKVGDLWLLGPHRLVIGDATDPGVMSRLCPGRERCDLMLTDPPYNVAYRGAAGKLAGDDQTDAQFATFLDALFAASAQVCRPGTAFYVFHSDTASETFRRALRQASFELHQVLVWVKHQATFTRHDYNWRHEPILYGWRPGAAHYFAFDFTETTVREDLDRLEDLTPKQLRALVTQLVQREATTTVLREDKPSRSPEHPTMKPVALLTRMVANSSRRGERVLDPCGGSGSTLIAAAKLGRQARIAELDPKFGDVILRRWQEWSGIEPTLDGIPMGQVRGKRSQRLKAVPKRKARARA